MSLQDYTPPSDPMVSTDNRNRAVDCLNKGPELHAVPVPDIRAATFAVLFAGDQLKRIADCMEQISRPMPALRKEPGSNGFREPRRALALLDARAM